MVEKRIFVGWQECAEALQALEAWELAIQTAKAAGELASEEDLAILHVQASLIEDYARRYARHAEGEPDLLPIRSQPSQAIQALQKEVDRAITSLATSQAARELAGLIHTELQRVEEAEARGGAEPAETSPEETLQAEGLVQTSAATHLRQAPEADAPETPRSPYAPRREG